MRRLAILCILAGLALVALDAFTFLRTIVDVEHARVGRAQAIVVFSGDPARVVRGFDLLVAGQASRLLVAGIDNGDEIARQAASHPAQFACCVDLSQRSENTQADAMAIAEWATQRGYVSLLVVTSTSHMPRALFLLHWFLPRVTMVPSAVEGGLVPFDGWRHRPELWRLLFREYAKLAVTRARLWIIGPDEEGQETRGG